MIICCGDICSNGNLEEIKDFFAWFSSLDVPHKIYTLGNHDLPFELELMESIQLIPSNVIFLKNRTITLSNGLSILNYDYWLGQESYARSNSIDIHHYPPLGLLDNGRGYPHQLELFNQLSCNFFFYGHVHECAGELESNHKSAINCSSYRSLL